MTIRNSGQDEVYIVPGQHSPGDGLPGGALPLPEGLDGRANHGQVGRQLRLGGGGHLGLGGGGLLGDGGHHRLC